MIRRRRIKSKENCIKTIINILEHKVLPKYGKTLKISRMFIHKQQKNKYYLTFSSIVDYVDRLRDNHKNTFESVVKDYLISVYERYSSFRRVPYLSQIGPSTNNMINFEEWIMKFEDEYGESYWLKENSTLEIIEVPFEPIDFEINIIEHGMM